MKNVEIVYVPFANPDGYEVCNELLVTLDSFMVLQFTWTADRLWRKNRRPPPSGSTCYGVDLNRNYDDHWGVSGGRERGSKKEMANLNFCAGRKFWLPLQ